MQRPLLLVLGALVSIASGVARAADAAPAVPAPSAAASSPPLESIDDDAAAVRPKGGEPAVKRTVIEDAGARIEELRVRGNLQKVTVAPKGHVPGYEVLTGDGFHATAEDPGTSRGSAGKRVWNVLRF